MRKFTAFSTLYLSFSVFMTSILCVRSFDFVIASARFSAILVQITTLIIPSLYASSSNLMEILGLLFAVDTILMITLNKVSLSINILIYISLPAIFLI